MVTASNAGAFDAEYNAGTSYTLGQRVYYSPNNKSYECVQAPALNRTPSTSPLYWMLAAPSNRWAMFDAEISTSTVTTGNLTATVTPGRRISAVTLHGLIGTSITVTQKNSEGTVLYTGTKTLRADPSGWYEYLFASRKQISEAFFDEMQMVSGTRIEIEIVGSYCACSAITVGTRHDIGQLQYGAETSIIDYSKKITSADGVQSFQQGRYSKRISGQLMQDKGQYAILSELLESVRATQCAWIGVPTDIEYSPLSVLGSFRSYSFNVRQPLHNFLSIEIESIT